MKNYIKILFYILALCSIAYAQDVSAVAKVGQTATLDVTASGTAPFTYQWKKDGVDISGATSPTYTVASAVIDTGGTYKVVATRTFDGMTSSTDSSSALVTVTGISAPSNVRIIITTN